MIYLIVLSALMIAVGKWSGAAAVIMALLVFCIIITCVSANSAGSLEIWQGISYKMCEILMALAVVVMEQILLLLK